jgi:hypothetical protein
VRELRPSPAYERRKLLRTLLRTRAGILPGAVPRMYGDDAWREAGSGARLVFFLLTIVGISAFFGFAATLYSSETSMLVTAVPAILVAEWLIERKRFFRMGPEEALWIFGVQAIVFRILVMFRHGEPEKATVLIGAGFLIAGLRLLNPFLVQLSAISFCWYAKALTHSWNIGASAAFVLAALALVLLLREWQRPSYDAMLEWLVVTMPILGYVALTANRVVTGGDAGDWKGVPLVVPIFVAIAAGSAVVALRRRLQPPLLVAIFSVGVVLFECRDFVSAPVEWKLIGAGAVVLAAAIVAERRLRDRDHGITSKKLGESSDMRLLEAVGGLALAGPATKAPSDSSLHPGGGSFGGGGASSNF